MSAISPEIVERGYDTATYKAARAAGIDAVNARVLAARVEAHDPAAVEAIATPRLSALDHYAGLHDIGRAAERVSQAIASGEPIGLVTDFDCDGLTAHALLMTFFREAMGLGPERVRGFVGHRLEDGYGLTDQLVDRIMAAMPDRGLIITADHGISDNPRIAQLAAAGFEVIVTDHHDIPEEGVPDQAFAVINPKHPEGDYPDPNIAGCMVAWLLCCAVARHPDEPMAITDYPVSDLLDYVALGTVADCVDLGQSVNNRAVVAHGLRAIRARRRSCWQIDAVPEQASAATLGFIIGPRINAASRTGEPHRGLDYLLAATPEDAATAYMVLNTANDERKTVESRLRDEAQPTVEAALERGDGAIVVALATGHAGVHGLVASRLVQRSGRTALVFTPAEGGDTLTGSARAGEDVHVREALASADAKVPGAVLKFGGHAGAGGITIHADAFAEFRKAFIEAVAEQVGGVYAPPRIETDGAIQANDLTVERYHALTAMAPYGKGFPEPTFLLDAEIVAVRAVGDGTHIKLTLRTDAAGAGLINAIWFAARESGEAPMPVKVGETIRAAVVLALNTYTGQSRIDCQIQAVKHPAD